MDGASGGQHLIGAGPYADIFGEVLPADDSGRIHQKLSRARNVAPAWSAAGVEQIVAANDLSFGIGQKGKGVAGLLAEVGGNVRLVYADGDGTNTLRLKFLKVFFNASQLEVTEWSPVSAIEDEQDGFRLGRVGHRTGKQLREGDGLAA